MANSAVTAVFNEKSSQSWRFVSALMYSNNKQSEIKF